jgi:hypothetical protein
MSILAFRQRNSFNELTWEDAHAMGLSPAPPELARGCSRTNCALFAVDLGGALAPTRDIGMDVTDRQSESGE